MVEKLEAERSSKTLPIGSGKMVRMGECEKEKHVAELGNG